MTPSKSESVIDNLYALVMAGGGGTRLWPISRRDHPKQMLPLIGERTMFQLSIDRLLPLLPLEHIFVVTAADQVAPLSEQYPTLPDANFIVEPMGRGTAPCIGLSAVHLRHRDPHAVMIVVTADHYIRRVQTFRDVLRAARRVALDGYLVTMGIEPTYPATGYGYIKRGESLGQIEGFDYYRVAQFTEKPDAARARQFVRSGTYAWNSGMFIWRVDRILEEIDRWMPKLREVLETLASALDTPAYEGALHRLWPQLDKVAIDYGVMERADRVAVFPVDLGWSDIGAWSSVMALHKADPEGNVLLGDTIAVDTQRTMVFSEFERLIAVVGVEDLIVVDTPDALLVTRRDRSERVREVVRQLLEDLREDLL
jgi:mannose-1-phosphate guanylyltransferase